MQVNLTDDQPRGGVKDAAVDFAELVVGLHWDPVPKDGVSNAHVDLDVACVLLNAPGGTIEVIHPGNPRHSNDCIIHTGDSKTGAGEWDDERIFVFPGAIPQAVEALTFVVASVGGRSFADIPRGACHVSDQASERELMRKELRELGAGTVDAVATLYRSAGGWRICTGARHASVQEWIASKLLPLLIGAKRAK